MLKRLKKTKIETHIAIRDWSDFFSHVGLMKLFIELLHIRDIVYLLQTCRRLYAFYNGSKFASAIITMIQRDFKYGYEFAPLRFLARRLNPKWTSIDGVPVKRFTSCYICSSKIKITKTTPLSSNLCGCCTHYSKVFHSIILPKVMIWYSQVYRVDQWPRIKRILDRLAVEVGQSRVRTATSIDFNIRYVNSQIFSLDLKLNDRYAVVSVDGALEVIEIEDIINEHGKREEAQPPIDIQTDKNVKRIKATM